VRLEASSLHRSRSAGMRGEAAEIRKFSERDERVVQEGLEATRGSRRA